MNEFMGNISGARTIALCAADLDLGLQRRSALRRAARAGAQHRARACPTQPAAAASPPFPPTPATTPASAAPGTYEAKQNGFAPGASSLHLAMTPHGPDAATFAAASRPEAAAAPSYLGRGAYAFMFETSATPRVTAAAMGAPNIDRDYYRCWEGLRDHFTGPPTGSA